MTFQVDGTCPYDFQTTVTSNNVSETHGSIFLRNNTASLNVFSFTATGAQSGVLAPGNYTLSILIQGSSHGSLSFDGRTQIDATFNVPAPAAGIAMSLFAVIALPRRRR